MVDVLGQLVAQARAVTKECDRTDLTDRLDQTARRLAEPSVRVLVVGEFKQGKSMLVNALLNAPVCPVDDDIATAVPTVVMHGATAAAALVFAGEPRADADEAPVLERRAVPVGDLGRWVSEAGNPGNEKRLACAEVTLPRRILDSGLVLVDTPGVGGLGSAHSASTIAALPTADAVLLVSDAAQEYSEPEIEFLRQAMQLCPNVACVLTKIDAYPQWRRIAELDRVHLAGAGVQVPLLPVSSTLRLHALKTEDHDLNTESGFLQLATYLQRDIVGRRSELSRRSVVHDVRHVTEHLGMSLKTELAALGDPDHNQQLIADLTTARQQAEDLRKRSARWQQTLNDGVADLLSDIDYDLRDRTRVITREAEAIIDGADPGQIWDQVAQWLQERVSTAVADNFTWAHARSQWLAGQVAEHFAESGPSGPLPELQLADTAGLLDPVPDLAELERGTTTWAGKVFIGMRGSYGGVLMFGLITGAALGMALINPISLGAGVLVGAKAYRDDAAAKLRKRRGDAKVAVRRQIDEVVFQVGKESKDRLRQVQRLLRDHFTDIAAEMQRSFGDSVAAAQRAAQTGNAERERRTATLRQEIGRLEQLQQRCAAVASGPPAPNRSTGKTAA